MRKPRPIVTYLQEIIVTRGNDCVSIDYKDPAYGSTTFRPVSPELLEMTDAEIMNFYNDMLRAESKRVAENPYVATEVPLGSPQIEHHPQSDQWSPRGNVLRCLIDDSPSQDMDDEREQDWVREPVIEVDGRELSWNEFGKMICTYAGWGMRIEFVPEEEIHRRPKLAVREPENNS
ncbi:MAG TPA: hypothetical protein EYQ50_18265 [Verrucomicrobiales bacterium]|nr:hypothetical protein [Verrucomicrobiales bacterium]HIL69097.1 hypothetical protein [Verrucomicrobiota bacterium]